MVGAQDGANCSPHGSQKVKGERNRPVSHSLLKEGTPNHLSLLPGPHRLKVLLHSIALRTKPLTSGALEASIAVFNGEWVRHFPCLQETYTYYTKGLLIF
jgi:hypothetical protein